MRFHKKGKNLLATNSIFFLLFFISGCNPKFSIEKTETSQYRISKDQVGVDSIYIREIAPYATVLEKEMKEVIGNTAKTIEKGTPEGLLGNLVTDACMEQMRFACLEKNIPPADFCLLNNGGLRNLLPSGPVTKGNIFELMPFENELVLLELNPEKLDSLLRYVATKGGVPVSGLSLRIREKSADSVYIGGNPLQRGNIYRVLTSDYLAGGGDGLSFLWNAPKTILGIKVRDAIIFYFQKETQKGKKIEPVLEGRIK